LRLGLGSNDQSLLAFPILDRGVLVLGLIMVTPLGSLQALVLATRKKGQTLGAMFARMLVVITKAIHVLVPALTVSNTTSKGTKSSLGLSLYFSEIHLGNTVLGRQLGGGGSGTAVCRSVE
jgi:hypothetical protein